MLSGSALDHLYYSAERYIQMIKRGALNPSTTPQLNPSTFYTIAQIYRPGSGPFQRLA